MFFIFGISEGFKELTNSKMNICKNCGSYNTYNVFITYMYLSLFFIPIFKWNIKYYVKSSCCNSVFLLNKEKGKAIKNGEDVVITDSDLSIINGYSKAGVCSNCGFETQEEYIFCPKCGNRL